MTPQTTTFSEGEESPSSSASLNIRSSHTRSLHLQFSSSSSNSEELQESESESEVPTNSLIINTIQAQGLSSSPLHSITTESSEKTSEDAIVLDKRSENSSGVSARVGEVFSLIDASMETHAATSVVNIDSILEDDVL